MEIKTLENTAFETILAAFLEAFENYFVPMPQDADYYRNRWENTGVSFSHSYGMFDEGRLVGFILQALGYSSRKLTAYNAGTGVIPAYRGKRIVADLYTQAIADLKQEGVGRLLLEVITENSKAIQIYSQLGFRVCSDFLCFKGKLQPQSDTKLDLEETTLWKLERYMMGFGGYYAWDNQWGRLRHSEQRCFTYTDDEDLKAYVVFDPNTGNIGQMECWEPEQWQPFLKALQQYIPEAKINNVNQEQTEKIQAITAAGMQLVVTQYEMNMWL